VGEAFGQFLLLPDAASMRSLIDWLDVKRQPRFLLLPTAAYAELRAAWNLPRLR